METGARARGLAGCARESAHGDGVSGRSIAAAKVRSSYTRTTARSGRAPQPRDLPLRIPAKMIRGGARCAILIASRQNIKNRANPLTTNEKTFSNKIIHFTKATGRCISETEAALFSPAKIKAAPKDKACDRLYRGDV